MEPVRIYKLSYILERCQWITDLDHSPAEVYYPPYAKPYGDSWTPIRIELRSRKWPLHDCIPLGPGVPVFTSRAVEALRPILEANGEILPFDCEQAKVYFYNVTTNIEALDIENTRLEFDADEDEGGENSEPWGNVVYHVFYPDRLRDATIFKEARLEGSTVYVTDRFVDAVNDAGLTGFEFRLLWTEDEGHIRSEVG